MKNKTIYSIIVLLFLIGMLIGLGIGMYGTQKQIGQRIDNLDKTIYTMALAQSYLSNNTIKCFELNNLFNNKRDD